MQKITFENLPSTNTPLNASNLNTLQDNIENTLNTYSTTETIIGNLSGQPVYRRVFTDTTPSSATGSVNFNNNIDTLVNESLYVLSGSNYYVGRGYYENNAIQLSYTINKSTSVYFSTLSSNIQNRPFTLILDYTKPSS